jgi:uncharacterized protein (TIGR04255 family)
VEHLANKPLIEVIFEIRWQINQSSQFPSEANTQLILGRLFDRLKLKYPNYEPLPFASVPEMMAEGLVKHRFRSEKGWPLVQIGSGILTVNDTESYLWADFKPRVIDVINQLLDSIPNQEEFKTKNLMLKYVDAIDIDSEEDIYTFLQDKMQLNVSLNTELFEQTYIKKKPIQLDLTFSFECEKPKGSLNFRIFQGKKIDDSGKIISDALIWEITIQSKENNLLDIPAKLDQWLEEAHTVTHNWFFTLVHGELLRGFQ